MNIEHLPSQLLENAVTEFSKLPGIGSRTALRLALHILKQEPTFAHLLGNAIIELRTKAKHCCKCNNISDTEICQICADSKRDGSTVCIVESIRDVLAIEATEQYSGVYHVLGAIISPMDGIGPGDLKLHTLEQRIATGEVKELIFALSTTMEGDTTNYYLHKKFASYPIEISNIARGISFGDELEYADEITLGRSIVNRTKYEAK